MTRAALLALVFTLALGCAAHAEGAALVTLATAKKGVLSPSVTAYGTVIPDPDYVTTIAIPRDGIVVSVSVRAGQLVRAGETIATIETAPAAAANFQQARSAASFAAQDLAHTKALYDQQLATKAQLAAAEKALADAKSQLDAQMQVGANRDSEQLRATTPGIVTAMNVSPGDRVLANAALASIATRDRLLLNLGLEPEDAPHVPVGAKVWLYSPQDTSVRFTGQVQSVDAMLDPKSRLVNAVVSIPNGVAPKLIIGMVLVANIDLPSRSGIVVPRSVILSDQGGNFVYIVVHGVAHRRAIVLGLETDESALISKGLAAGDRVVVSGAAGLDDGASVRTH